MIPNHTGQSTINLFLPRPRFGYFSVAYSSHIGDQYYSTKKKQKVDENSKIVLEKRNPYANPMKRGKSPDVYFSNMFFEEKNIVERQLKLAAKDAEDYLVKAKSRKKGSSNEVFKAVFKPGGPKEYGD